MSYHDKNTPSANPQNTSSNQSQAPISSSSSSQLAPCDYLTLIVDSNGNPTTTAAPAYVEYSTFSSFLPHGQFKYEGGANAFPNPNPTNICMGSQNNMVHKLMGVYVSVTQGSPLGGFGTVLPGMPQAHYNQNATWDDVLVDLIAAGYANPGDNSQMVINNPAFQSQDGKFYYVATNCICPPPPPSLCTFQDIKNAAGQYMYPVQSQHPSQPMSVWYASFLQFQQNMWNNYQNAGCIWWYNRINNWQSQITSGVNNNGNPLGPFQISLLNAKIDFAQHMHVVCGCFGPPPVIVSPIVSSKTINGFNVDYTNIPTAGENKDFEVFGSNGAEFYIEIKNEDNHYYNFFTKTFTSEYYKIEGVIANGSFTTKVLFPAVTDNDQYDIFIYAKEGTSHVERSVNYFRDGSIDLNSSTGSNGLLLQKVLYQVLDVTLTLSMYSASGAVPGITVVNNEITIGRYKGLKSQSFTSTSTRASNALTIDRQPLPSDLLAFVEPVVGSAPIQIPGENIYPTDRAGFTGDDINGAVTSGSVVRMDNTDLSAVIAVGDKITTPVTTDTVNGAVEEGIKVVMDNNVAIKMAVGDQVTGSEIPTTKVVTVAELDPDGDNIKEFSLSEAIVLSDGVTLTFSSKINRSTTTVTVVETSGTATDFTMSQAIQFRDDAPLTFTPQANYRWPIVNARLLAEGMIVVPDGANVGSDVKIADYEDTIKFYENTEREEDVILKSVKAVERSKETPTVVNGIETVAPGEVIFNQQMPLALAGDSLKVGGYGLEEVFRISGWDVKFNNLKVELNEITTTKSSGSGTSMVVASAVGIADETTQTVNGATTSSNIVTLDSVDGLFVEQTIYGVSAGTLSGNPTITSINEVTKAITLSLDQTFADGITLTFANSIVSGPGIVAGSINPYVTNISGTTLTLSASQTLENGQTFTFANAGNVATLTGNVTVKKAGSENLNIRFDVDKFLTYHS